jgi:hypothetical protein
VLAVNGLPLGDAQSLQRQLFESAIGRRTEITVLRNGAMVDAVAVPGELSDCRAVGPVQRVRARIDRLCFAAPEQVDSAIPSLSMARTRERALASAERCAVAHSPADATCVRRKGGRVVLFDLYQHSLSLPDADAGRRDANPSASSAQLTTQIDNHSRRGRTQRVTDGDGAAIDVHAIRVDLR